MATSRVDRFNVRGNRQGQMSQSSEGPVENSTGIKGQGTVEADLVLLPEGVGFARHLTPSA